MKLIRLTFLRELHTTCSFCPPGKTSCLYSIITCFPKCTSCCRTELKITARMNCWILRLLSKSYSEHSDEFLIPIHNIQIIPNENNMSCYATRWRSHDFWQSHNSCHILNSQQNQNQMNQILHLLQSVKSKSAKKRLLVTDRSDSHLYDIVFHNV